MCAFRVHFGKVCVAHWAHVLQCQVRITRKRMGFLSVSIDHWSRYFAVIVLHHRKIGARYYRNVSLC